MAIISSFLCWLNTRTGSVLCGYFSMVVSMTCIVLNMLRYMAFDEIWNSIELKCLVYGGIILYSLMIGVSLILVAGVYMDRKFLLLPWIYVLVLTVLYESGATALITTIHLEQNHTLSTWEIVTLTFYCIRLVANCYSFACVVSQYQELSEGRGTYEFLYKPEMARTTSLPDIEEYQPPFGASLPPYSQENPYKEYSPPNYENLSIHYEDVDNFAGASDTDILATSEKLNSEVSSAFLINEVVNGVNYCIRSDTFTDSDDSYIYSDISYPDIDYPEFNIHDGKCHKENYHGLNCSFTENLKQKRETSNLSQKSSSLFNEISTAGNLCRETINSGDEASNFNHIYRDSDISYIKSGNLSNESNNSPQTPLSIPHTVTSNSHRKLGNSYKKISPHISRNNISQTSLSPMLLALDSDAIAMTLSSSCMNYSTNSVHFQPKKFNHPTRTKYNPTSPVVVQKRTYITWI